VEKLGEIEEPRRPHCTTEVLTSALEVILVGAASGFLVKPAPRYRRASLPLAL